MTLGIFFTSLGYLTGIAVLVGAAKERKLLTEGMMRIGAAAFLGGIVGAKLTEWIFSGWPFKIQPWLILDPSLGGKSLLGGILIGWGCAEIAKRRLGIRRSTGDLFALALPAGEAVGRIGCFFNSCCYGTATSGPIAIYQHDAWRHPTQLYSALVALTIFVLLCAFRKRMLREGDLFRLYLVLFGITRFGLEFIREQTDYVWGLSAMQWFCMELFLAGLIGLALSLRNVHIQAEPST